MLLPNPPAIQKILMGHWGRDRGEHPVVLDVAPLEVPMAFHYSVSLMLRASHYSPNTVCRGPYS